MPWNPSEQEICQSVKFALGLDGMPFAYWPSPVYSMAWEYAEMVYGPEFWGVISHFSGYENACLLQHTIGM